MNEPSKEWKLCPFGEDEAPGAGCIKEKDHSGPHLVVPGDVDHEDW